MKWDGKSTVLRTALFDGAQQAWPPTQEWFTIARPPNMKPIDGVMQFEKIGKVQ